MWNNIFILYSGVNPASQGSSLTEGKRTRRSKKNGDAEEQRNEDDLDDDLDNTNCENDDDDWGVDVSEEAVRARQQELSEGVKSLAVTEDTEKSEKDRMDIFYKFFEAKLVGGKLDDKELLTEAERLDVRAKAALILAELLFSQNILAEVSIWEDWPLTIFISSAGLENGNYILLKY